MDFNSPLISNTVEPNSINISSQLQQVTPPPIAPPYNPNLPVFQPIIFSPSSSSPSLPNPTVNYQQSSSDNQSIELPQQSIDIPVSKTNILEVENLPEEKTDSGEEKTDSGDSQKKKVSFEEPESSSNSSSETRKITL